MGARRSRHADCGIHTARCIEQSYWRKLPATNPGKSDALAPHRPRAHHLAFKVHGLATFGVWYGVNGWIFGVCMAWMCKIQVGELKIYVLHGTLHGTYMELTSHGTLMELTSQTEGALVI